MSVWSSDLTSVSPKKPSTHRDGPKTKRHTVRSRVDTGDHLELLADLFVVCYATPAAGRPISAADNGSLHSRLVALFNLGSIPKSRYVLADAIVLHKNSQAQGANGEEGMLELVRMISEERLPATFFELDGEEGRENTRTETA